MKFEKEKVIEVLVPIPPKPKQSVRGGGGNFFTCPKARKYVNSVISYVQPYAPPELLEGALMLDVVLFFPFNKTEPKKNKIWGWLFRTTKPDCDNCLKPIQDALEKAGFYKNDSQISRVISTKIFCNPTVNTEGEFLIRLYKLKILE